MKPEDVKVGMKVFAMTGHTVDVGEVVKIHLGGVLNDVKVGMINYSLHCQYMHTDKEKVITEIDNDITYFKSRRDKIASGKLTLEKGD